MKLEGDHVLGVQTPTRKSYNPFDSDDEIEDSDVYLKSSLNGYDIKCFETNVNSLTFHWNSSDLSWEEEILGHSQIFRRTVPTDSNCEEVIFRKDTKLFMDKTVTDCELPQMMDYYKENAYHNVKDIGVDEGMPVHDKVSIESKKFSSFRSLNDHIIGDTAIELPYMEGLKSRAGSDSEKDVSSQNQLYDSLKESALDSEVLKVQQITDQVDIDDSAKVNELKDISSKEQSTSNVKSTADVVESGCGVFSTGDPEFSKEDGESFPKLVKQKQKFSEERTHESSSVPSIADAANASAESSESRNMEAIASQSSELPASQEAFEIGSSLSYDSEVESGRIILDFNSLNEAFAKPPDSQSNSFAEGEVGKKEDEGEKEGEDETDEEENSQHNKALEKPPESQSMPRHDEESSASIFNSRSDSIFHGETSISAAIPCPASVTYRGEHGHTGSISLRSDSSAGSTRSFAFPVLQVEWNSSPVRMAKADRRNFRRHRGWVRSLICCKF